MDSIIPSTLAEATDALYTKEYEIIAGGTDLAVKYMNQKPPKPFLFIKDILELKTIKSNSNTITLGACLTLSEILNSNLDFNPLNEVLSQMSSPAIRNIATIGGNICNASPAGDLLPLLYALDAHLILESKLESRKISVEDFIIGIKSTDLKHNEILKEVVIPKLDFDGYSYSKIGPRKANALSKISFIAFYKLEGDLIKDIRISFGAIAPQVLRLRELEQKIIGLSRFEAIHNIDKFKKLYESYMNPITDQRSTSTYRKSVASNLLEHFLYTNL